MSDRHVENVVVGQGLAGSSVAWRLHWAGQSVLVIDDARPDTASRVSAGLVTPVTGQKMVKALDFDQYWESAKAFYERVSVTLKTPVFHPHEMIRLLTAEQIQQQTSPESPVHVNLTPWQGKLQTNGRTQTGVTMSPAGRLDVSRYLQGTREFFSQQRACRTEILNLENDIEWSDPIRIKRCGVTADRIILCQGASPCQLFPNVPNNPSRGDILSVKIPNYQTDRAVHRGIWIADDGNGHQTVGSTYDWKNLILRPSLAGREELLVRLAGLVDGDVEVTDHRTAIRPTMKDYQPVTGSHSDRSNVYLLNGLGSRGALKAPYLSEELLYFITEEKSIPAGHDVRRRNVSTNPEGRQAPLTQQAQAAVAVVVKEGDTGIDATVGNGYDTEFMAIQTGPTGRVFGFDVQSQALDATARRLQANDLKNVTLINTGHQNMGEYATHNAVSAIMFNLGFLPRSDHTVITKPESTSAALKTAVELLKEGGVLTVLSYRGHEGGEEEYEVVQALFSEYSDHYDLQRIDSQPARSNTPVLFVLKKVAESAASNE